MNLRTRNLSMLWRYTLVSLLLLRCLALNNDGTLLISLKKSILGDPLSVLVNWNYYDETPCSWRGVTCTQMDNNGTQDLFRVTSLALPESQLLGSIPEELGMIQHLQHLDLSSNFFNGSLPISIFNASELQFLSLSNNVISSWLPEAIGGLKNLQFLNLSDNAFAGSVPKNLSTLQNLTVLSLRSNYFSGSVPSNFSSVELLDLSSNLFNGSLPVGFYGEKLRYLNLSYNKISNSISSGFGKRIPTNATIDLSFNNLTGAIPQTLALLNQKPESFAGNENLCGKPLKHLCSIPSSLTLTTPSNMTVSSSSTPAIAAIPKTIDSIPATESPGPPNGTQTSQPEKSIKPITIAAIAVGDLAGIAILSLVIFYFYHYRKRKNTDSENVEIAETKKKKKQQQQIGTEQDQRNPKKTTSSLLFCLANKGEETSETTSSDNEEHRDRSEAHNGEENRGNKKKGVLVTVDGETKLELETLLKASAYILGASGGSIVYKAVLEDGTAFAVRRIGENGIEKLPKFQNHVRAIAKLRHPNLVKIRGFYWGEDEKLIIYDYLSNGCLANSIHRKPSCSSSSSQSHQPQQLSLEVRLKIARGIACGLAFLHEKKQVHANLKPSNILFNSNMDPFICDFGLNNLIFTTTAPPTSASNNLLFGRSAHRSALPPPPPSYHHYQAPEFGKNLKPNLKWDVYSFGVILIELVSGRSFSQRELKNLWRSDNNNSNGCDDDDDDGNYHLMLKKMTDMAIRSSGEVEIEEFESRNIIKKEEDLMMRCFKLGFSCVCFVPQKRPTIKQVLHVLDNIITAHSSSFSASL